MRSEVSPPRGNKAAWRLLPAAVAKTLWAAAALGGLLLLWRGLWAGVYFAPTEEAIAEAQHGRLLVGGACLMLLAAALHASLVARWPHGVAAALLAPALLWVGLTLFASETLFPLLAVLIAYPTALAGVAWGLLARRRDA